MIFPLPLSAHILYIYVYTYTYIWNTQTHRHRDKETHRHTDTRTHRHTDTQTKRHTDTRTHRHTDTQTRRHADTQTHRHTDRQTHRHTDTETRRHRDTQTQRHTDTHQEYSVRSCVQGLLHGRHPAESEGERGLTSSCRTLSIGSLTPRRLPVLAAVTNMSIFRLWSPKNLRSLWGLRSHWQSWNPKALRNHTSRFLGPEDQNFDRVLEPFLLSLRGLVAPKDHMLMGLLGLFYSALGGWCSESLCGCVRTFDCFSRLGKPFWPAEVPATALASASLWRTRHPFLRAAS